MTTDPDALTEAERNRFDFREWADYVLTDAADADLGTILANVERFAMQEFNKILSARAAALRADIARDIKAACDHFGWQVGNPAEACGYCHDAARIALGGTDE